MGILVHLISNSTPRFEGYMHLPGLPTPGLSIYVEQEDRMYKVVGTSIRGEIVKAGDYPDSPSKWPAVAEAMVTITPDDPRR